MLPQKRREVEEVGSGRGGFEVRVIGGASPPRAVEEDRAAEVEEEQGAGIGLRIGAAPLVESRLAEDWEEEPVHRLEAEEGSEPLKIRATTEVGPAVPYVSRSGKKKKSGLQRMTMWMGIASCGIAVAATAGALISRKSAPKGQPVEETPAIGLLDSGAAEKAYFITNANALTGQAEAVLRRYVTASSVTEVFPLVRDAERMAPKLSKEWKSWGTGPAFSGALELQSLIETSSERPIVTLIGTKGDFTPFKVIFVREKGEMKLDWEATYGSGDVSIPDLRNGAQAKESVVRAMVRPSDFFTADFPEGKFRSYQLLNDTGDTYIWAFAPVDSQVTAALGAELNEGSSILKQAAEVQATLKLTGPAREGMNQFLITEMLHKGWVSP
jgi:hypothetical protein